MSASTSLDERWRLLLPPNTVVVKASTATDGAIRRSSPRCRDQCRSRSSVAGRAQTRPSVRRHH